MPTQVAAQLNTRLETREWTEQAGVTVGNNPKIPVVMAVIKSGCGVWGWGETCTPVDGQSLLRLKAQETLG